ncbi:MAG: Magnesium-protoporphyrin O-methyltransferase [Pelotomaculum sp. PtaU1.Bin065]|nr:MAG: Magnesium-protoporphyrin O-methyltransferase [Pelotomaculum sp. PtaU1.Bin065]
MENEIKLFYDLTAEKTADEWYNEEILKPTIIDFLSLLPETPRVLDLGCGPGHESMRLAGAGASVVGIDFSEECIRIANKRCPQCEFKVMDFRYLDDSLGRFDGIFACASLIHISPAEISEVINNIRKFLKDDGYAAIIVIDGEGISKQWSLLEVEGKKLNRAVYLYTKESLQRESVKIGFEFVREGYLDLKLKEYGWRNYIFKKVVM